MGNKFRTVCKIFAFLFIVCFLGAAIAAFIDNEPSSAGSKNEPAAQKTSSPASVSSRTVPASAASCTKGNYVTFGRFPQNNSNIPEPIEWLVLDNDGARAFLVSKFGLDCKRFHDNVSDIGWDECDLRKWLNDDFLNQAFTFDEQRRIAVSNIYTGDNLEYGTKGCGETFDQVFCLSIEEAYEYFASNDERKCQPTIYAVSHNVWKGHAGNCFFWLRSPGSIAGDAAGVLSRGAVASDGNGVNLDGNVVRPALRIIL